PPRFKLPVQPVRPRLVAVAVADEGAIGETRNRRLDHGRSASREFGPSLVDAIVGRGALAGRRDPLRAGRATETSTKCELCHALLGIQRSRDLAMRSSSTANPLCSYSARARVLPMNTDRVSSLQRWDLAHFSACARRALPM